jgi:hypothetical protein
MAAGASPAQASCCLFWLQVVFPGGRLRAMPDFRCQLIEFACDLI